MAAIRGGKLLEKALAELAANMTPATLRVGFLERATYPDGTPVGLIAAFNEFGTSRAPPRPFFRPMVREKSSGWPTAIAANLKATKYDTGTTLRRVGEGIKGQLQDSIRSVTSPPLAQSTIKRKGHSKPLIDSGHMLNSVDYEVNEP